MSIVSFFTNPSKIRAAEKKTARARKREGDVAERLFQEAFQDFQKVVSSDPVLADALYHWGFALFHQAQTRTGAEAEKIYQDAGLKFAFCMTVNPQHLGAAIDWGATLMEQARQRAGAEQAHLYSLAREKFLAANAIQSGSASYNLACIHAIRGELDECRNALDDAKDHGSLPNLGAMLNDSDLAAVQHLDWFKNFVAALEEPAVAPSVADPVVETQANVAPEASEAAEKPRPRPKRSKTTEASEQSAEEKTNT